MFDRILFRTVLQLPAERVPERADNAANAIGNRAFSYCKNLQSIILREDVKKVDETAFWDCFTLKKVTIEGYPLMIKSDPEMRHRVQLIHFGNYGMTIEEIYADRKWLSAYTSEDLFLEKDVLDDALPQRVHKGRLQQRFKRQKRCLECGGKRIAVPKGIIGKNIFVKNVARICQNTCMLKSIMMNNKRGFY